MTLVEQAKYVCDHFIPLSNGDHVKKSIDDDGCISMDIIDKKSINTYLDRLHKDTKHYYNCDNQNVRNVVYKFNKPEFYDDKINLCGQIKSKIKPYQSFSAKTKSDVEIMLNHIKVVIADNNEKNYNYVLDWYAYMFKGGKNKTILYYKSSQGAGKSTVPDFIRTHVIGNQLALQSGAAALRSNFNAILAGKLFVTFEELENFSISDWANISSTLKRWSTSDVAVYEKKGIDSFSAENINNYNCIGNHDSIKDDQGRRYFKADISSKYTDNSEYFDNIYDNCFNDEVGEAFFNLLIERDLTKYDHTRVPLTQAKLDSFANRLCPVASFLKDVFVLKNKPFFGNVGEIYKTFVNYSDNKGNKICTKIDFCKQMREWNMDFSKHSNELRYKITYERLLEHANKSHWIHETDEFVTPIILKVEESVIKEIIEPSVFKEIVQPKKKPLNVMDDAFMKLVKYTKGKVYSSIKEVCKIVESVISSLHSSSNYIDESDDNNDDDLNESDFTIDFENQEDDPL